MVVLSQEIIESVFIFSEHSMGLAQKNGFFSSHFSNSFRADFQAICYATAGRHFSASEAFVI